MKWLKKRGFSVSLNYRIDKKAYSSYNECVDLSQGKSESDEK